jgi:hypothetical protein
VGLPGPRNGEKQISRGPKNNIRTFLYDGKKHYTHYFLIVKPFQNVLFVEHSQKTAT